MLIAMRKKLLTFIIIATTITLFSACVGKKEAKDDQSKEKTEKKSDMPLAIKILTYFQLF
jgi:protein involved in sex pheromone biosynthesis